MCGSRGRREGLRNCAHSFCNAAYLCKRTSIFHKPSYPKFLLQHTHCALAPPGGTRPCIAEELQKQIFWICTFMATRRFFIIILIFNSILIFCMERNYSVAKHWWCLKSREELLIPALLICFPAQEQAVIPHPWENPGCPSPPFTAGSLVGPSEVPYLHRLHCVLKLPASSFKPRCPNYMVHQTRKPYWVERAPHHT